MSGYRPISLFNVTYKIITKVLTLRLNPLLDKLIDTSQSGFIPGRFILDGIAIAQQLMFAWVRQRRTGALLKLDFAKPYDMLN